jgi:hypothetical protein
MAILKPGRKYIGSINVKTIDEVTGKKLKTHSIFLTSDIVLICRLQEGGFSSGKLTYVNAVPITQVRFAAFGLDKFVANAFVLKSDTEAYNFWVHNPDHRSEFIDRVKAMKKAIREQVSRQTEDGADFIQGLLAQLTRIYTEPHPVRSRKDALDTIK